MTRSHGGVRSGAGRKPGSNAYGESTKAIRVPLSTLPEVQALLERMKQARLTASLPPGAWVPDASASSQVLPLFSHRVTAGFPSPADDYIDQRLDLNEHLVDHPAATFYVRVQGDSMTGANIHDGDMLVVDRALEPVDGKIVIASVNGELTVKRLKIENEGAWLIPENPDYPPLKISEGLDCVIWGVVAHVIHSF